MILSERCRPRDQHLQHYR